MANAGPLKKITVYKFITLKVTLERDADNYEPMSDMEFEDMATDLNPYALVQELDNAQEWDDEYNPREFSNYKPGTQYRATAEVIQRSYGEL